MLNCVALGVCILAGCGAKTPRQGSAPASLVHGDTGVPGSGDTSNLQSRSLLHCVTNMPWTNQRPSLVHGPSTSNQSSAVVPIPAAPAQTCTPAVLP